MVMIFVILQALGHWTQKDINSIKIHLRRDVPMSLEEEDCSQLIFLLDLILFALIRLANANYFFVASLYK